MTKSSPFQKGSLLIFTITLFTFLMITFNVNAQNPFKYERPVMVRNTGATLTGFQVPLVVNTQQPISMGHMTTNGRDIRFTTACGGTTYLPYWIQAYMNTDSTRIWVKMNIPANDSVLVYMYYGNPGATPASTLSIFSGPHSSIDSLMTGSINAVVSNSQRGFQFSVTEQLLVTHFGKREPTGTTRYVTLWNYNAQSIIMQAQVPGPAASYQYLVLPAPFILNPGTPYLLTLFQGVGDGYYYGTSSQVGQHLTYVNMKYCNSCTQNTFPTSTLNNYQYGYPDFLYYTKQTATPAPTFMFRPWWADTVTPGPPQNLSATNGNGVAHLIWSQNPEMDLRRYNIFRNTTNNPGSATLVGFNPYPDTTYTDNTVTVGNSYYYWLKAVDSYCIPRVSPFSSPDSTGVITGIAGNEQLPTKYELYQNYPNPFNPTTSIRYDISKASLVKIYIYDVLGREVAKLVDEYKDAGRYEAIWYAQNQTTGFYIYKIEAGDYEKKMKMMLVK